MRTSTTLILGVVLVLFAEVAHGQSSPAQSGELATADTRSVEFDERAWRVFGEERFIPASLLAQVGGIDEIPVYAEKRIVASAGGFWIIYIPTTREGMYQAYRATDFQLR